MRRLILSLMATLALAIFPALGTASAQEARSAAGGANGGATDSRPLSDGPYAVAESTGYVADALGTHRVKPGDAIYLPCAAKAGAGPELCHVFRTAREANAAFKAQSTSGARERSRR